MLSNSTKYSTLRNSSLFQFSRLTNNETKIKKYILLYIYILYIIKNVLLNTIDKIEWIVFTNCINFPNFDNNTFLITLLSIKTNNKLHSSHSLISLYYISHMHLNPIHSARYTRKKKGKIRKKLFPIISPLQTRKNEEIESTIGKSAQSQSHSPKLPDQSTTADRESFLPKNKLETASNPPPHPPLLSNSWISPSSTLIPIVNSFANPSFLERLLS